MPSPDDLHPQEFCLRPSSMLAKGSLMNAQQTFVTEHSLFNSESGHFVGTQRRYYQTIMFSMFLTKACPRFMEDSLRNVPCVHNCYLEHGPSRQLSFGNPHILVFARAS